MRLGILRVLLAIFRKFRVSYVRETEFTNDFFCLFVRLVFSRLSHLLQPSTTLLTHIFRLSYFLLPPSPAAMNALKQCLHYDPDSKICLSQHRLVKAFDKGFAKVEEMMGNQDWRGVVKMLLTPGGGKTGDLWRKFEEALEENVGKEDAVFPLVPPNLLESPAGGTKKKSSVVLKSLPMPNAAKT